MVRPLLQHLMQLMISFLLMMKNPIFGGEVMYPISDHFDGKHFYNPWGGNDKKTLWDILKWKLTSQAREWPTTPLSHSVTPQFVKEGAAASVHVTYLGHSTVLIQDQDVSVLTDPQFSERASPVSFLGPKRFKRAAVEIQDLPRVDIVLVSHNHYDHLDLASLVELDRKFHPKFIVPLGNAKILRRKGIENVVELDWWQKDGKVQLVPVQHWSARGLSDRNEALWGGFLIYLPEKSLAEKRLTERKIFFAGDTGYGPHFKMIHEKVGSIDLSILPIGAYEPRSIMKQFHMNPQEALQAHVDLHSKQSFAMHFETFRMTDEGYEEPRQNLLQALTEKALSKEEFFIPQLGETLILK